MHVPVILIPMAAIGGLVIAIVPRWYHNSAGPWVALAAVLALGALDLTMNAGSSLRTDLHLNNPAPGVADIVNRHAAAAGQLRVIFIAFTALLLITLAVHATDRASCGVQVGDRIFARIRSASLAPVVLRVITGVLALLCLYWVYHVGDLGAQAVWASKFHGAH